MNQIRVYPRRRPDPPPPPRKLDGINVVTTGGIGDHIIALPWLQNLAASTTIDVPLKLFTRYPDTMRLFVKLFVDWMPIIDSSKEPPQYSATIELSDFVNFKFHNGATPDLLPPYARAMFEARSVLPAEWQELATAQPFRNNETGKLAVKHGINRWTMPFFCTGVKYRQFNWHDRHQIPRSSIKFITVHDGFDANHNYDVSMKSWPIEHWGQFVFEFKRAYPDIQVIQIGAAKHRPIPGVHTNLAGKLVFKESLHYLKSALVHVDGDSGLVHARRLFQRPSVVIFGPTNHEYFGYPENVNIAPSFCGDCWWKKSGWMRDCVAGYNRAVCMETTKPSTVLGVVSDVLEKELPLWST